MFLKSFHRAAKRKADDMNFYGGVLHVCYAPEYETIDDVRTKMKEREDAYCRRIKQLGELNGIIFELVNRN